MITSQYTEKLKFWNKYHRFQEVLDKEVILEFLGRNCVLYFRISSIQTQFNGDIN